MAKYNSILDVNEFLNEYANEIQESITEEVERIAIQGKEKLKQISPKNKKNTKHKGRYAKGWKVNVVKGRGYINATIYNSTDYQLTHLLEKGHLTKNGGKVNPVKHIEPIHDECIADYEFSVEKIIKNGG